MINIIILIQFIFSYYIDLSSYYHISYNNYQPNSHLIINKQKYRETLFNQNLEFIIYLQTGYYNFSVNPNIKPIYSDIIIISNYNLIDKIIIYPNTYQKICNINYYEEQDHIFNLIGNFRMFPYLDKTEIYIKNDYITKKINQDPFYFTFNNYANYNDYEIIVYNGNNQTIFSNPSIGNGFNNIRYLVGWNEINNYNEIKNYNVNKNNYKYVNPISLQYSYTAN